MPLPSNGSFLSFLAVSQRIPVLLYFGCFFAGLEHQEISVEGDEGGAWDEEQCEGKTET